MSDLRRPIYKQAMLAHAHQNVASVQPTLETFDAVKSISPALNSKKTVLVVGLLAVGLLHIGLYAITQLNQAVEVPKKKITPVVVEIIKHEPEKPKFIQPKIPPVTQQPNPQPVVEDINSEPVKQQVTPKPMASKPAPVLMAKADAPATKNVVEPLPEPIAAPPEPKKEDLPVIEAKGYAGYLSNPAPEYPEVAFDRGWEGRVLLRILVSVSGSPEEIILKQGSGKKVLDDAAIRTVKRWKFSPAKRGPTSIEGWVDVPIDFKLPK